MIAALPASSRRLPPPVNDGAAPPRTSIVAAAVSRGSTMVAVAKTPDWAACQAPVTVYAALAGTPAGANLSASPLPGNPTAFFKSP
jgi:hypothetical protein